MTETIQQLKEDIAVLQEKLQKLEEIEKQPRMNLQQEGDFDVVSYHDPQNTGDEIYWRIIQPNSFSWWRRYIIPHRLDMVQNKEKEQELEQLYQEQLEREMIKRNLKTSLQELVNGDVRPIDDVVRETKNQQVKELVRESVKWCEEHPNENPLDWLNTQPNAELIEKFLEKKKEVNDELIEKALKWADKILDGVDLNEKLPDEKELK